uniref:AP-4 complex subunit epsilon-like n=1 Tax=Nicotiana tabacum TaxID=4097 RepID=A0A1S4D2C2_TOBAC|nr:PREDICTED: AP-4 complex subunit epsilon-like [Nicotiana tabacum]
MGEAAATAALLDMRDDGDEEDAEGQPWRRAIIAINDGGYKTGDSDQERKASEMKKVKESLKRIEYLKEPCVSDIDFGEIYAKCGTFEACTKVRLDDEYLDKEELKEKRKEEAQLSENERFFKVEEFLLREGKLCVSSSSWRELLKSKPPELHPRSKLEQLKTIGRELAMGSQGGFGQSKEFLDLIKSIGEARSKAEEDRIVINEIETLKKRIIEPDIPKRKMKEYIIRLVYVEMLGHDASFGYIHAVKMTHDDNLHLKRTGYLAVTLFLNEDHDLIILIVNTIQKDLKSDNYLVVCAALNAVCKLINEETIPAVLPQVVELLGHSKEAVRKKAVMALHRFFQKSPSSICHLVSNFRKRLCDNDPGVMGATLCPLYDLIAADVNSYKDLVVSFVSILKQVAERRLPKSYDYHQMPAPFIQIKLLKILALLGSSDKKASEQMYTIVGDIMRKSDSTSNIGNAILYECICCVSSIHPNPKVLESAAEAVAKFLKNDSHNLKYLGIDALGRLIKISAEIAEQHQLAVIDCLEVGNVTSQVSSKQMIFQFMEPSQCWLSFLFMAAIHS